MMVMLSAPTEATLTLNSRSIEQIRILVQEKRNVCVKPLVARFPLTYTPLASACPDKRGGPPIVMANMCLPSVDQVWVTEMQEGRLLLSAIILPSVTRSTLPGRATRWYSCKSLGQ